MYIHIETQMPECDHCGAHVSRRFARVFADEQGRIRACPDCSANAGIAEAARERTYKA
jgi:NAD-dependent SIR2 family protein deacetylase